jgi:hypothetical protein
VIGHDQPSAVGGDVLDALGLDAEPVAVVEVQRGLDELEDPLRTAPVVDGPRAVGRRKKLAQRAGIWRGFALLASLGQAVDVVAVRVELLALRARFLRACVAVQRPAEQRAVGAQAPASS